MNDQQAQELLDQLDDIKDLLAAMAGVTSNASESLAGVATAAEKSGDAIKGDTKASEQRSKVTNRLTQEEILRARNLENAFAGLGVAVKGFATQLLNGTGEFAKYNSALASAGEAAYDLSKNFGLAGQAIGLVIKATFKLAQMHMEQVDLQVKFRDALNQVGGAGAGTTRELTDLARQAGYSSKDLEKLAKPMKTAGEAMAVIGQDGAKTFLKMANVGEDVRRTFRNLGISQEELTNAQANYMQMQRLSGYAFREQAKDQDKLKKNSIEYAENLAKLAALTGKDIASTQQQLAELNAEFEEQVEKAAESNKLKRINDELARQDLDQGRRERLEREKASLEKEKKNREELMAAMLPLGKSVASDIAQITRLGAYDPRTGRRANMLSNAGLDPMQLQNALKSMDPERFKSWIASQRELIVKAGMDITEKNKRSLQALGEQGARELGIDNEFLKESAKFQGLKPGESEEEARRRIAEQKGGDAALDARNLLTEAEISAKKKIDELTAATNPLLNGFNKTTMAAYAAATALGVLAASQLIKMARSGLSKIPGLGGMAAGAGSKAADAVEGAAKGGLTAKQALGRTGIAAVGGLAAAGLGMAGDAVGGTTGKVLGGAGNVVQGAAIGAMLGPVGALIGGLGGLAYAVISNTQETKSEAELLKEKQEADKIALKTTNRLNEENNALSAILGTNSDQLKNFNGRLGTMSDQDFKNLIEQLKTNATAAGVQTKEIEKQTKALTDAREKSKKDIKAEQDERLKRKEIDPSKKFTAADTKALEETEKEMELLQNSIAEATTKEEKEEREQALKVLNRQYTMLREKKETYDKFHELETDRIVAEQKKIDNEKKTNEILDKAKQQRLEREEKEQKYAKEKSVASTKQGIDETNEERTKRLTREYQIAAGTYSPTKPSSKPATGGKPGSSSPTALASAPSASSQAAPTTPSSGAAPSGSTTTAGANVTQATPTGPLPGSEGSRPESPPKLDQAVLGAKTPEEQIKNAGLKVRPYGDVYQGGLLKPTAVSVAQQVQQLPGFGFFTGLNDIFHQQKHPRSKHAIGQGIDFTMAKEPTRAEAKEIKAKLSNISGVTRAFDEYYEDRNGFTTGGHFHLDTSAADGAVIDGPQSGYPVDLTAHGREIIAPLEPNSILEKISKATTSTSENIESVLSPASRNNNGDSMMREMVNANVQMYNLLSEKLDAVIETLGEGNDTNKRLLKTQMI